ncbi:GNAT family N-acetyltransferase [Paracoccus sp. NFXS7]|uniref:GNAT family N-acetyltransferase n=1 Tax=Paracoccus sp. NFXS7 TaxID=2908653 RepID=UPI0032DE8E08
MHVDLTRWSPPPAPARAVIAGRYVRLEPLQAGHAGTLYAAASAGGADDRFRWLFEHPPQDRDTFADWVDHVSSSADPMFFAVVDAATGRAEGRQALMRIDRTHGVIEIGSIMWGPALQRSRMATEALFLFADHVFALGYRRFEWKCNDLNTPSKRAALRFGFRPEGVFRQHMVVKGTNRDTAWFAMTDQDWQELRPGYLAWLAPDNFDSDGVQRSTLGACLRGCA